MDTRSFKRSLHHSERYNRRGFGLGEEVAGSLQTAYQSDLIASLRTHGHELREGRLTVRLAEAVPVTGGLLLELLEIEGGALPARKPTKRGRGGPMRSGRPTARRTIVRKRR